MMELFKIHSSNDGAIRIPLHIYNDWVIYIYLSIFHLDNIDKELEDNLIYETQYIRTYVRRFENDNKPMTPLSLILNNFDENINEKIKELYKDVDYDVLAYKFNTNQLPNI